MQNQICESMVECIDKKHKMKFLEINSTMCDMLRQEIMQDTGHSKLKAKTLDLITKLRLEANVLNANKTARNTTSSVQGKSVKETTENEKPEKEPLGLDENGQVKLTHDAEDIKQMLEMGMLK